MERGVWRARWAVWGIEALALGARVEPGHDSEREREGAKTVGLAAPGLFTVCARRRRAIGGAVGFGAVRRCARPEER